MLLFIQFIKSSPTIESSFRFWNLLPIRNIYLWQHNNSMKIPKHKVVPLSSLYSIRYSIYTAILFISLSIGFKTRELFLDINSIFFHIKKCRFKYIKNHGVISISSSFWIILFKDFPDPQHHIQFLFNLIESLVWENGSYFYHRAYNL